MIPGEPELIAKNIPAPHIHSKYEGMTYLDIIRKKSKQCRRCGEFFVTDLDTQSYCPTCRGGEMGMNQYYRFLKDWNHGTVVTGLLEDMRK